MQYGGYDLHEEQLAPSDVRDLLLAGLVLVGLAATELHTYLLFHCLSEAFSIVIACGIFMVVWNTRRLTPHSYFLLLGVAYLFVAAVDLLHMLAFEGMSVFRGYDADLSVQLWIGARAMQSVSLLLVAAFVNRRARANVVLPVYALVTATLLLSIFYWRIFPQCFVEGEGLTAFKKCSEFAICLVLLAAIVWLHRRRREMDRRVVQLLTASIAATIISELAFTLYETMDSWPNKLGHLLKIISFYLIYKAVIERTLVAPYTTLFRDLRRTQESLRVSGVRFRRLVEEVGDGILVVSRTGEVRYINPAAEALLGLKAHEFRDKPFVFPTVPGRTVEIRVDRGDKPTVRARMRVVETSWEGAPCHLVSLHTLDDDRHRA